MSELKLDIKPLEDVQMAKPIDLQRLEAALDIRPFINQVEKILNPAFISDSDNESNSRPGELSKGDRLLHGVVTSKEERQSDRTRLFNFNAVDETREWLKDVLLSSTDSESDLEFDSLEGKEGYIKGMLKEHVQRNKYSQKFYKNPNKRSWYMYYGTGVLSTVDKYTTHGSQKPRGKGRNSSGPRGRRGRPVGPEKIKRPRGRPKEKRRNEVDNWEDRMNNIKEEEDDDDDEPKNLEIHIKPTRTRKRGALTKEGLTLRRRKLWQLMSKKEVPRVQRSRANVHKETQQQAKRLASLAARVCRQRALLSQKNMKETLWRCKRLSREMQSYWKRYDRAERETRRRLEKEAEEQRKMDVELMEAKRQRRKLNFLITQTELYAHFMQKKMVPHDTNIETDSETHKILEQLDEDRDSRIIVTDQYDSDEMKARAESNARAALAAEAHRMPQLPQMTIPLNNDQGNYTQPNLFRGTLKGYQLKGMNWLASLYHQGISGILADEMGLGKTVQCIAFLCHCAEILNVWGPFLVVSPASTLHNWQQELEKFAPDLKVVPYWGSPGERKILRQFWERKDLHTRSAAFHVVVTSYQIVVSDLKYLNRIAWQYMILDEAQAIKSSASVRWKLLLGFSCRNRLLLSGTPIQNSMAELWALLHFIMPTLFDSHDEFNEWFSKDIESHAENKSTMDEKHLSRLHMILKPFMLRRIKKDVENELSDKIEIMVHCPLTIRQKLLYMALKKKIKIEELLNYSSGGDTGHNTDKNFTSNLMNLVMQFRKVCNHPELFERRDVKSPFYTFIDDYNVPVIVEEGRTFWNGWQKKVKHWLCVWLGRWHDIDGAFDWTRLAGLELHRMAKADWLQLILYFNEIRALQEKLRHREEWWRSTEEFSYDNVFKRLCLMICGHRCLFWQEGDVWRELLFVVPSWPKFGGVTYSFTDHIVNYMAETLEHRSLRARAHRIKNDSSHINENIEPHIDVVKLEDDVKIKIEPEFETEKCEFQEFEHVERKPIIRHCQPTELPAFLYCPMQKVVTKTRALYAYSRASAYRRMRHELCETKDEFDVIKELYDEAAHKNGWSYITVPDKNQLVSDAGKLTVLDSLLKKLKERGSRVLIYSQMTKMIDILEEYMWHRKHKYMRLDGSSKISARRDMVADFQARSDIFAFLLSTRAGGLGINLTAADTVIFYDSDWNPTVDQQAMDRAHRLGQTKQVTVYRLICRNTIEERIVQRATEKSEIQRMVISGGNFKPDTLKPKEVVSLLLDDDEIVTKYRQRMESSEKERKRKSGNPKSSAALERKKSRLSAATPAAEQMTSGEPSAPNSEGVTPSQSPTRELSIVETPGGSDADQSWMRNSSWRGSTSTPNNGSGWVRGAVGRAGRGRPRAPRGTRPKPLQQSPGQAKRGPGRPRGGLVRGRARDSTPNVPSNPSGVSIE